MIVVTVKCQTMTAAIKRAGPIRSSNLLDLSAAILDSLFCIAPLSVDQYQRNQVGVIKRNKRAPLTVSATTCTRKTCFVYMIGFYLVNAEVDGRV